MRIIMVIAIAVESYGFNFMPETTFIFGSKGTKSRPDYFGFSVGLLMYDNGTGWLLSGAPRSNSSDNPYISEPGILYKCRLDSPKHECYPVTLDKTKNGEIYESKKISRDHIWTGATIDISSSCNITVCAPRWKMITDLNETYSYGKCYVMTNNLQLGKSGINPLPRVKNDWSDAKKDREPVPYYAMAQLGMSLHSVKDTSFILLGAPGFGDWSGSVGEMKKTREIKPGGTNRRKRSTVYKAFSAPNPFLPPFREYLSEFGLFGYSLTAGYFSRENIYYVGGAPTANNLLGLVIIYNRPDRSNSAYIIKDVKKGTQTGEYFGASVAAFDIDNNGFDDLVVGAPHHTTNSMREVGCVYVFMNRKRVGEKVYAQRLTFNGKLQGDVKAGSRFGTTLASVGDLDDDSYQDLLVGAPYEDNHGAVYVFNGHRDGIGQKYSQKLYPIITYGHRPLRGFGISFSKSKDVDGNHFPDIAIGSYLSDNAAIMFTRPVISLSGSLTSYPSILNVSRSRFELKICNWYKLPRNKNLIQNSIMINYTVKVTNHIMHNGMVTFVDSENTEHQGIMSVKPEKPTCTKVSLKIADKFTKYTESIKINLLNDIITNGTNLLKTPMTDLRKSEADTINISFNTGCEKDGNPTCQTKLSLLAYFEGNEDRFVIGNKQVTLHLQITNTPPGEPAYFPEATITVDQPVDFTFVSPSCLRYLGSNNVSLVCQLTNPIRKEDNLEIDLDLSHLSDKSNDSRQVFASIGSPVTEDVNPNHTLVSVPLNLQREATINITGSHFQEVFYSQGQNNLSTKAEFDFKYATTITKTGRTTVGEIEIYLLIPESIINIEGDTIPLLHIKNTELHFHGKTETCQIKHRSENSSPTPLQTVKRLLRNINCTSNNVYCAEVICNAGPWNYNSDSASLEVFLRVNFTTLRQTIHMTNESFILTDITSRIISTAKKEYDTGQWSVNISKKIYFVPFVPRMHTIKWWTTLLAIIAGALVMTAIIYTLHKKGFFERKKKAQLEASKKDSIQMN